MRTPQSAPIFLPPNDDPFLRGRRGLPPLLQLPGVGVEVVEQLRRAVRPQILDQARTDVRVARHDHERRRCPFGGCVDLAVVTVMSCSSWPI